MPRKREDARQPPPPPPPLASPAAAAKSCLRGGGGRGAARGRGEERGGRGAPGQPRAIDGRLLRPGPARLPRPSAPLAPCRRRGLTRKVTAGPARPSSPQPPTRPRGPWSSEEVGERDGRPLFLETIPILGRGWGEGGAESSLNPEDLVTPSQLATPPAFFSLRHGLGGMYLHSGRPPRIHITSPQTPRWVYGSRPFRLLSAKLLVLLRASNCWSSL